MRRLAVAVFLLATAASGAEYRAFWVDTFNTRLGTRAEIDAVIEKATAANANALFAQVRRRGDSWYAETLEPLSEVSGVGEPDANGRWTIDPLRYLIEQAHARGIEVHAYMIVAAVFQGDPATRLPRDPRHVFLQHVWDRSKNAPYDGATQWGTRSWDDDYQFGTDFWLDLGHPDAAAYTAAVITHLASHYEVDGIHLDRVRYPETEDAGYNETTLARFNARYGRSGRPSAFDPLWSDWRREQVTNFVRRVFVDVKAVRPQTRVSAALIAFGSGPTARGGFANTDAYWRVFQDWDAWAREGILDLLVPMDYKNEASAKASFDDWMAFAISAAKASNRLVAIGLGAYLNSVENTMKQAQRSLGAGADGVVFYSLANPSIGEGYSVFSSAARNLGTSGPPATITTTGHLRGFTRPDALVELGDRTLRADGNGFYAFVHLQPGWYRVRADGVVSCLVLVKANEVATVSSQCAPRRRAL